MALIKLESFKDMERFFETEFPFLPLFSPTNLQVYPTTKFGWDLSVEVFDEKEIDIFEEKENVFVDMNLPGIDPDKIEITFPNGHLKVYGTREELKESIEKNYCYKEIKRGAFERLVKLPVEVMTEKVQALYKNGVLRITLPKKEVFKTEKIKVTVQ